MLSSQTMKLGILETGIPPADLLPRFGDYPAMFSALLGPDIETRTYKALAGELPQAVDECDAYLITGSATGVYDDQPWIAPLAEFLRAAKGKVPLVGICFGHQLMAEAFGGEVIKSPKGWGIGLQRYQVARHEPWMDEVEEIAIPASHQDQVVRLPPGASVCLASEFAPYAGLTYDADRAISFQGHPEFDPGYGTALAQSRRGTRYTEAEADTAIASLTQPNDRQRVAGWIRSFLQRELG